MIDKGGEESRGEKETKREEKRSQTITWIKKKGKKRRERRRERVCGVKEGEVREEERGRKKEDQRG